MLSPGFSFFLQKVSCADSNVGDAKVRGISGGEKKRLSLACELIASPSVIFADEPTTGMLASVFLHLILVPAPKVSLSLILARASWLSWRL